MCNELEIKEIPHNVYFTYVAHFSSSSLIVHCATQFKQNDANRAS